MSSFTSALNSTIIPSGASLSAAIDLGNVAIVGMSIPAAVAISFQGSLDNITYYNIYKDDGSEYTFNSVSGVLHALDLNKFLGVRFLKIRSGTAGAPAVVASNTAVTIITKEL